MFSLEIECDPEDRDLLVAELWEQGSAGIVELSVSRVRAFFDDAVGRERLQRMFPGSSWRNEEEKDWVQSARDLLQPMKVGERFFLVPAWREDAAPEGRFRITVNPGMAFGTGVHETTQLCIEALERTVRPGIAVLDVGTGSGILAKASAMLGASKVYACDTDPVAVRIAGDGFVGSVDAVASESVDLVVANISPEAVIELAPEMNRVVRGGGVMLVSGFETREVQQVLAGLDAPFDIREKGNWALIHVRKIVK